MTDISRPARRRRRIAGAVATAAALALTAVMGPAGPASAGQESSHRSNSSHARTFDVMTRNLYLGADLTPVIAALASGDQAAIVAAATQTWGAVQATNPPERMAAIADEIVKNRPAVVGLQEVTRWTTYDYNPATGAASNPQVQYDFLELLLKALADKGVVYHEVEGATADNFASPPIPIVTAASPTIPTKAVSLLDRDVILRRDGVRTWNSHTGQYTNILSFPVGGQTLPVKRGWGSTDVRTKRAVFRFVNTHLEAFGLPNVDAEGLRVLQVQELLAAQAAIKPHRPTVYVGDYNSDAPTADAYRLLVKSVGHDAWSKTHRRNPGYTCCFDADLRGGMLDSRIDLVLYTKGIKARHAEVIGDEPSDKTASGLYPSDHAGVVASLKVRPSRHHHHHHRR